MEAVSIAIITGLTIGFLGSMHCIGMCGPLALSLPIQRTQKTHEALARIGLYNLGRATTYGMLGMMVGLIGSTFNIWGWQRWLSIAAGVAILLVVAFQFRPGLQNRYVQKYMALVRDGLSRLLAVAKTPFSFFLVGNLNALLPCGLVYVGLTAGLATANALHAGVLLFAFGFGTMPAMMLLMIFRNKISYTWRFRLHKLVPYVVSIMAMLLILRGLNLGIPYLSPAQSMDMLTMPTCHQAD